MLADHIPYPIRLGPNRIFSKVVQLDRRGLPSGHWRGVHSMRKEHATSLRTQKEWKHCGRQSLTSDHRPE